MNLRNVILAGAAMAGAPAMLQAQQISPTAVMGVAYNQDEAGHMKIRINVDDAAGPLYFLMVSFDEWQSTPLLLGPFPLDATGNSYIVAPIGDASTFPDAFRVDFKALFLQAPHQIKATPSNLVVFNSIACETLDPDFAVGGTPTVAGEVLGEQWGGVGLHISCDSQLLGQPNKAIIFDSSNPTGNDGDLATPGYGPGNTTGYGKLIIVAENDVDANNDNLVDDPDDAFNGGLIHFNFDDEKTICFATIIDIDDSEPNTGTTKLRFYTDNAGTNQIAAITVPPLGDNSAQTLLFEVDHVRRMDVKAGGSMGLAQFGYCPKLVNFDTNTVGMPLNLSVGEKITNQFPGEFTVSAVNQTPAHPDEAILFDSASPTGGDVDLLTPGIGIGNTIAQGKVLVVAENVIDADNNTLVDNPDDEATGGKVFFDFDYDVDIMTVTLIDTDDNGPTFVECVDENGFVLSITPAVNLGNNCSQTLVINQDHTRKLKVVFGGSGAIADITYCPCYCAEP